MSIRPVAAPGAVVPLFALLALPLAGGAAAADVFEEAARVLETRCLECHSGPTKKGGLSLASRADLIAGGDFGKMVALRGDKICAVPIRDAVSNQKYVDPDGQMVATARSVGVFPAPFAPMSATMPPSGTASDTPFSTSTTWL